MTSAVSGQVIEIPVEVLILVPPTMSATVDGISRTVTIDGTGHPGARARRRRGRSGGPTPDRHAAPLRSAATGHRSPSGRLAYTGAEVAGGVTAAAALLAAGLGLLHLGRAARRRASDRA